MRSYSSAREGILDAAERLVARDGVRRLGFGGVAQEAGVSRGGVLYHFASKEALIGAMVERLIERFEGLMEALAAADPEPHGRWARAYARATLEIDERTEVTSALLAAIAHDPELLAPLRERLRAWRERTEEGLDATTAAVVRLAAHALWLNGLLRMNDFAPGERRAVVEHLVRLTSPGEAR